MPGLCVKLEFPYIPPKAVQPGFVPAEAGVAEVPELPELPAEPVAVPEEPELPEWRA